MSETLRVTVVCHGCQEQFLLTVDAAGFYAWQAGMLIQTALPALTEDERELLISQTCGPCWDLPPDPIPEEQQYPWLTDEEGYPIRDEDNAYYREE
jgi:hypothetical protein